MAIYKARGNFKDTALLGDETFSHNFHVESAISSDDAWDKAAAIAGNYLDVLCPATIELVSVSIDNPDAVNGVQTRAVGTHGTRVVTGDALPGWNVASFQASTSIGLRKHTWFLRMGLTEADVAGQVLAAGVQTVIGDFLTALQALGTFVDKDGEEFTIFTADPNVKMRQMGWHRRTRPGFHRGWVAN